MVSNKKLKGYNSASNLNFKVNINVQQPAESSGAVAFERFGVHLCILLMMIDQLKV
jgi:hypothetical protein